MNTIIYARVSTDRQTHESQIHELREYCRQRGWTAREIVDTASGAKASRAGLTELMSLVRAGQVSTIICYKLDRLGRSLAHLAQILSELTKRGVALLVPGQGIDTSNSNPAAQLQVNILCAVAEFEREVIRERVKAGLAAARARGRRLGSPNRINALLPQARQLVLAGEGISEVGRALNISRVSAWKLVKQVRAEMIAAPAGGPCVASAATAAPVGHV
jgi:DNA invertase Pin-like site-specific DNA recombinase